MNNLVLKNIVFLSAFTSFFLLAQEPEKSAKPEFTLDSEVKPNLNCGTEPAFYFSYFKRDHQGSNEIYDVHYLRNLSARPTICKLFVTYDIEVMGKDNKYELDGKGRICLKDANEKRIDAHPKTKKSRITRIIPNWSMCNSNSDGPFN